MAPHNQHTDKFLCHEHLYPPCPGCGKARPVDKNGASITKYKVTEMMEWTCTDCKTGTTSAAKSGKKRLEAAKTGAEPSDASSAPKQCLRCLNCGERPIREFALRPQRKGYYNLCRECQFPTCIDCGEKPTTAFTNAFKKAVKDYRCESCKKKLEPRQCKICNNGQPKSEWKKNKDFDRDTFQRLHQIC